MKLSNQILLGLKRLANQALVSEECFNSLLNDAPIVLTNSSSFSAFKLHELTISKPDIAKEAFASLIVLLVESSRHNIDGRSLVSLLENYNLNQSRVESIGKIYEIHRSSVQRSLKTIGKSRPKLINVQWRLDFCIKSSNLEQECRPVYFIKVVTEVMNKNNRHEEYPEQKVYSFMCSKQQLQEFVLKLKDAARVIQSFAAVLK